MRECVNSENVGQVEELLLMTEQMQDELDQKDQTIMELNRQLSRSLSLNEKLNSENRAENIEALRTRLRKTEQQLTSETDSRKRADAEVVAWKFKYEKAEQAKRYAQTHQKTVEVSVEKKVPYEKCDNCDRTAYQKAKEKCDNRKISHNRDWLSGGKNLPEILLGYYQHHGDDNEYSYRNLFWRMDKICSSDKPYCTVTTCACGLYWNSMLCERLAGRTGILLIE